MEDIATRGAQKAIEQLLGQMQQQQQQQQTQHSQQPNTPVIPANILTGISPDIVNKGIEVLLTKLLPDQTSDISLFNEKKLAQIGMRYLYLLLNQADNDLRKLEKVAGVKPDSPLHEVV